MGRTKKQKQQRQGNGGSGLVVNLPSSAVPRAIRSATTVNRVVRKVFAHSGTLSTNASGYIAEQAVCGNNSVQASTAWSAASGSFLEYRVVGIQVWFFPVVNCQTNLTTPAPTMLALSAYSSGLASTTFDEVAAGPNSKIVDGRKPFSFVVSCEGNIDPMQWTATNVAIPAAESYGVVIAGDLVAPAASVSTVYFHWTAKYLTELRSLD